MNQTSTNRGERWSIYPAITTEGYLLEPLIIEGSVMKEIFTKWVKESVLPYTTPGRTIIIMDNCKIHKDELLIKACTEAGVIVDFLPPYCPDLNPIEFSFNELKAFIRRNNYEIPAFDDFGEFLGWCIGYIASPEACKGYYRKAGYCVD